MQLTEAKAYRRDCLLGALGALLMLVGDLCLSIIPAAPGDSGLFTREAYLNGSWEAWRLPLLVATGLCGMALGFFAVRASCRQLQLQCRKTRLLILAGGVIYVATAGALHFFIGSLADWTSTLAPLLGREETAGTDTRRPKALFRHRNCRRTLYPPAVPASAHRRSFPFRRVPAHGQGIPARTGRRRCTFPCRRHARPQTSSGRRSGRRRHIRRSLRTYGGKKPAAAEN